MASTSKILTMTDVAQVEQVCLTKGSQVAFSTHAMLEVLRSYRQAIAVLRIFGVATEAKEFLEMVDKKDEG